MEIFNNKQNGNIVNMQIPNAFFGREKEISYINNIFKNVISGKNESLLISGYAGVGKSALVNKIYYDLFKNNGFFIYGKFDQFDKNIPYKAIIQAFQGLITRLLEESQDKLEIWKSRILKELGPNGQVIINVIPLLESIIGKQPALPELGPLENQNRFQLYFQKFINVFTGESSPLIMFIDDLQWADIASLNLMKTLISNLGDERFFFIGAYRDNEVGKNHPLKLIISDLRRKKINIHNLLLGSLNIFDVRLMISNYLECNYTDIEELGEVIFKKTGGNPFFVNEFLKSIYRDNILMNRPESSLKDKRDNYSIWQWDIKKIADMKVTDNVADLFIGRITKFLIKTQELIKLAACIGSRFDLDILAMIYGKSKNETFSDFAPLIKEGLLFYVGGYYNFVHDKIQEAVYSMISDDEKKKIHYQIAVILLDKTKSNELDEKIFYIMDQFGACKDLIIEEREKIKVINLYLLAGEKAKESTAYDSALKYFEAGINFLGESSWFYEYDTTLSLYTNITESAYLNTDFESMEKYFNIVIKNAKSLLDKIKVYEIKIQAYFAQNKFVEAIYISKGILRKLGVVLPKNPNKLHIIKELIKNKIAIRGKTIDDLRKLPQMTDLNKLAAIRIMVSTGTAAYYAVPDLLPVMILKIVNIALKYGNSPDSPFYFIAYGFILCTGLGDIRLGYKYSKFAINLIEYFNNRKIYPKVHLLFNTFINHLKNHLNETLTPLRNVYQVGLEVGDQEYAALGVLAYCENLFFLGKKLSFIDNEIVKYQNVIEKIKQDKASNGFEVDRQMILKHMTYNNKKDNLLNKYFDEEKMLKILIKANDRAAIANLYTHKLIFNYLHYDYKESLLNIKKCKKYIDAFVGLFNLPIFYLYYSLTLTALYPTINLWNKLKYLFIIKNNQKKMKKWAKYAPMNYLHKYYLVEAELARIHGNKINAVDFYDKAISLANENGYLNEEALSYELAAKFYLSIGNDDNVKKYIKNAYNCYMQWEAYVKVKHIEVNYKNYLKQ